MIYLIQEDHSQHIKLGYSKDVTRRISELRRHCGKLKVLKIVSGSLQQEKNLHRKLAPFRVPNTNEWYVPNHNFFKRLAELEPFFRVIS